MLVFLTLLLLAVQVLYGLYTTSVVTAATYDAARIAAGSEGTRTDQAVEARVRQLLGSYFTSGNVTAELDLLPSSTDPDEVVVTVTAERLSFLPASMRRPLRLDTIQRVARVRVEKPVGR